LTPVKEVYMPSYPNWFCALPSPASLSLGLQVSLHRGLGLGQEPGQAGAPKMGQLDRAGGLNG
jgi:hypothetical protein